ncbi:uncharacterized protein LOC129718934 [Wyeomyia smithii]|uniref:uncharacterized protein LOC129718934 n=1 Tax=Wyeomyia smithii TaxID=174621 RepID=UPI002467DEB9|nr:uncharacterized protein LOC129718934 [Wyeomyia smithii]
MANNRKRKASNLSENHEKPTCSKHSRSSHVEASEPTGQDDTWDNIDTEMENNRKRKASSLPENDIEPTCPKNSCLSHAGTEDKCHLIVHKMQQPLWHAIPICRDTTTAFSNAPHRYT